MNKNSKTPRRWGPIAAVTTVAVALGAIAAGAVLVDGYDVQDVPRLETAIWVTRDDGLYARVNTDLGEIDTVRSAPEPSGVIQFGSQSLVFTQGFSQAWPVDGAFPRDLGEGGETETSGATPAPTPAGTDFVASAGGWVSYLTATGEVFLGPLPASGATQTGAYRIDPFAALEIGDDEDRPVYVASATALNSAGAVVMYSHLEQLIRVYRSGTNKFDAEPVAVPSPPATDAQIALTFAGNRWVLFSASEGLLWAQGRQEPIATGLSGDALLQSNSSGGNTVALSDANGMVFVDIASGEVTRQVQASGTPAAPVHVDDVVHGAWLTTTGGELWVDGATNTVPLALPAGVLDDDVAVSPVFRHNGDRAILSETTTGMLWLVPSGTFIDPVAWDPLDEDDEVEGTVLVDDIVEQEPPVAVADVFGVRRGALVTLPLLYNDHDPNKRDVLSIDSSSVSVLSDSAFGELSLVGDDQQALIRVAAASGSATFTYSAHDGMSSSAPATVTLNVVPDDVNNPPVWCGVESCTQQWPAPQIAPGGYVSVPVLNGWVDPEGDVMALMAAQLEDPSAPISVVPTADGSIVIRHMDPNGGESEFKILLTIADAFGATAEAELVVRVTASPPLEAKPIALATGAGESRQVQIADFVTGGSGSYRLVDAMPAQNTPGVDVNPITASGVVELTAAQPGYYLATYTVEDTVSLLQQTATIRFTAGQSLSALSLPPLVAFVRPNEDATLDVLATAQNTTGRVLMVSQVSTSDTNLGVSAVDETYVRVSGSTDDGLPGRIGVADVTVTDGGALSARTQLTVFLLPAMHQIRPVAIPDTLSVRAGTQVDIGVLNNDVSPRGERLLLLPQVEGSGTQGELAFASGSVLRYLAPEVPGVYTLYYTTYLENFPERTDTASVTITVVPPGANRAPQPPELVARVLAGQAVAIPFKALGVDPDGDDVYLTDVEQPQAGQGATAINAAGDAIIYRSPAGGVEGGQVTFEYTVTDPSGARSQGVVRVGVLDPVNADVAPVTYSDYVGAQIGSPHPLSVTPLVNDRDPMRGTLKLIDVRPNALPGSLEYDRLASLIDSDTSLEEGVVSLLPGDVLGSHSYVYTVESSTTLSTAEGLIVLGVMDQSSPDQLRVTDTVLTASSRYDLGTGVDVVTGKVQWQTGDIAGLSLEVWGEAADTYTAQGWTIRGPLPATRTLVPFRLSGEDSAGNEVVTYGFLKIPGFQDLRMQRRGAFQPYEVEEEQSISFDIREVIDVGAADALELRPDPSYVTQRENAVCSATGPTTVTYSAGREAPWTDICAVPVRLPGQDTWSVVAVPITIIPLDPEALLNPASRTISPGESDSVELLADLVTWEGGRVGNVNDLNLSTSYSGSAFTVTQTGNTLTAQARADAAPGTRETVTVSSTAFGGLTTSVTLVVGMAVPDAPRGANFSHQCDVSNGASCTFTAVGLPGEYDPFLGVPGAGLTVTQVGLSGSVECSVASVTRASETTLVATWPAQARPEGGDCAVDFTVADAQGRTGQGSVNLDILGYPQPPASVNTFEYTGTSVTLIVSLGNAANAHPAVTGVNIYKDGVDAGADCRVGTGATYFCQVNGLVNGERHSFMARAVNSVGESGDSSTVQSWAYAVPAIVDATGVQAPFSEGGVTTTHAKVNLVVEITPETDGFRISGGGFSNEYRDMSGISPVTFVSEVGDHTFVVEPLSKFEPPNSSGPAPGSKSVALTIAGTPFFTSAPTPLVDGTTVTVSGAAFDVNYSSAAPSVWWYGWTNSKPTCNASGVNGNAHVVSSSSNVISGLNPLTTYNVGSCVLTDRGVAYSDDVSAYTWVDPGPPPGPLTYSVSTTPTYSSSGSAHVYRYGFSAGPTVATETGYVVRYLQNGAWYNSFAGDQLGPAIPQAFYCAANDPTRCADEGRNVTAEGNRQVTTVTIPLCYVGTPSPGDVVFTGASSGNALVEPTADGTYTITWVGAYETFNSITRTIPACEPEPEPEPEPGPEPEPEPGDGTDD